MYSSHSYPYQFGNQQQQPQQPPQHSPYTPGPQPPQQPGYPPPRPSYPAPQQPSYPHPHQQPPQPPPRTQPPQVQSPQYPPAYSPPQSQPVSMPLLQRPDSDQPTGSQQIGDPRFVLLMSMDTDELNAILENDEKFEEVLNSMEELKLKRLEKEMALAENRSLADFNLSREPRLTEGRAQLITRLHEAQRIMDSYTVGKSKLESLRNQNSLDTAVALMQAATADAEDESEEVAEDFLKGDMTVEDFLERFMPKRQTAHLRHIKSEKIQEILTSQQQGRSAPSSQGVAAPNTAYPPYSSPQHANPQPPPYNNPAGAGQPYGYQPQRPAPRPPIPAPRYMPGSPARMPTLGSYPN